MGGPLICIILSNVIKHRGEMTILVPLKLRDQELDRQNIGVLFIIGKINSVGYIRTVGWNV